MEKIKCLFCGGEIEAPQDMNEDTKKCSCGAIYWQEITGDGGSIASEAAEALLGIFEVDQNILSQKIEIKILKGFDKLGEEKGSEFTDEVNLVFARLKSET